MSSLLAPPHPQARIWHMPIVPETYDRSPLTLLEQETLGRVCRLGSEARGNNAQDFARTELMRLQTPIYDVIALRNPAITRFQSLRRLLYCEMCRRGIIFWQWTKEEWIDIICPTYHDFTERYGTWISRPSLMDIAYLLGGVTDLREVGQKSDGTIMAQCLFGSDMIEREFKRITDTLVGKSGRGYSETRSTMQPLMRALCMLFLLNRSPLLEDLSLELLQMAIEPPHALVTAHVTLLSDVLQGLGILKRRLETKPTMSPADLRRLDTSEVPQSWVDWCLAWIRQDSSLQPYRRRRYLEILFTVGRWLTANHPGIVSPEQWDDQLALEYVNYVSTAKAGEYVSPAALKILIAKGNAGNPLKPSSIHNKLCAMTRFFKRLQDRPHVVGNAEPRQIDRRFNPTEAFATPQHIRRLIQPDPRDIDEISWCKLTYAAATLTEQDYSTLWQGYPLSYYHAAALLWVTSARRPNEIIRLQVGCIRRDWDPAMLDEYGVPLPGQEAQLCYLHIPAGKTKGPYWVPIPKYTADAVEAWEQERPDNLPRLVDTKDNSLVEFLFCMRGKKMGRNFFNETLIPALCRRAGVPERDARGTITGHRARSTIATMLRRNGLSLEDISQFLGHARLEMVRAYARTDQFRFGRDMNRANDLMRIVEGIIDTRAAKAGRPNVFFFLGRGADGQPRFCGNPAWEKCAHRLACLKCPRYVGANQAARLAERLEARDEIFKFQARVEMTLQEKAAAEGDIERLSSLIEADAQVPPPLPPDEQFRFNTSTMDTPLPPASQEAQLDLATLGRQLAALKRDLAAAEKRTDGRNATIRSLKKQIAEVTAQMSALDQVTALTQASLES